MAAVPLTVKFATDAVPENTGLALGAFKVNSVITCVVPCKRFPLTVRSTAVAIPVKAGLSLVAFKANWVSTYVVAAFNNSAASFVVLSVFNANCAVVAVETGLLASLVLSTLDSPTVDLDSPPTVPEKVGLLIGALAANALSAPIEGNTGVYVVKNTSVVKAPALKDHTAYVAKLKSQSAGDVNRVLPALKDKAEIKDNRKEFNY